MGGDHAASTATPVAGGGGPGSTGACPFGEGGREFVLYAQAGYPHAHSLLKKARQESPVFHQQDMNFWVVSRHEDVVRILHDEDGFSSKIQHVILGILVDEARELLVNTNTFRAPNMGFSREPDHARLRRPFVKKFSAAGVAEYEPYIRRLAAGLLDELASSAEPADLVQAYSRPLATRTIMQMIGLSDDDYDLVCRYGEAVHSYFSGVIPPDEQIIYAKTIVEWEKYLERFVDSRRREPRDDLTSYILQGVDNGEIDYTQEEIVGFLSLDIVGGGIISTAFALPNLCRELQLERRYWDALREDPEIFDKLFAEAIRRSGLGLGLYRQTTRDVELSGVTIPKDSIVWLMTASADYDEEVFQNPESFEPGRPNSTKAVSFGYGMHYCLGHNLAKLVTRVGLEELMRRHPGLRLTEGQPIEYEPSLNVMVLRHLLVDL